MITNIIIQNTGNGFSSYQNHHQYRNNTVCNYYEDIVVPIDTNKTKHDEIIKKNAKLFFVIYILQLASKNMQDNNIYDVYNKLYQLCSNLNTMDKIIEKIIDYEKNNMMQSYINSFFNCSDYILNLKSEPKNNYIKQQICDYVETVNTLDCSINIKKNNYVYDNKNSYFAQ